MKRERHFAAAVGAAVGAAAVAAATLILILWPGLASADGLSDAATGLHEAQRGNDARALRYYSRALWSGELPPDLQVAIYFLRALAHARSADYENAIADYDGILDIEPGSAEAHYNRGVTHAALGDLKAALADYDAAIRLGYPALHKALFNRGEILEGRGDFEAAVADFKAAFKLAPEETPVRAKAEALGLAY